MNKFVKVLEPCRLAVAALCKTGPTAFVNTFVGEKYPLAAERKCFDTASDIRETQGGRLSSDPIVWWLNGSMCCQRVERVSRVHVTCHYACTCKSCRPMQQQVCVEVSNDYGRGSCYTSGESLNVDLQLHLYSTLSQYRFIYTSIASTR